jgi:hypothetical protein
MAGSSKTGDDMEAGRVNRAEDQTVHWAQQRKDGFFDGNAIMVVEPARDIDDDDFEKIPERDLSGVVGTAMGGGVGIIGINMEHPYFESPGEDLLPEDLAHAQSAGVFGKGATGVVGQGEVRAALPHDPHVGIGVLGRGGKNFQVVGTGVVGFGGGVEDFVPKNEKGTGVFGVGNAGVVGEGFSGPGVRGFGSDSEAGVIGIGGKEGDDQQGNKTPRGTGVIGFGSEDMTDELFLDVPEAKSHDGTGVYGVGQDGVKGFGIDGRGGVFVSKSSAQVRLVPAQGRLVLAAGHRVVEKEAFTPNRVTNPLPGLPMRGQAGDLMTLTDNLEQCTLWFCVQGGTDESKAIWAQILLGPTFDGQT